MKKYGTFILFLGLLILIYYWYQKKYSVSAKTEKGIEDAENLERINEVKSGWFTVTKNYCEAKSLGVPDYPAGFRDAYKDSCNAYATELANEVIDWQVATDNWFFGDKSYIAEVNKTFMNNI